MAYTADPKDIKIVQSNWLAVDTDIVGVGVDAMDQLFNFEDDYADAFVGVRNSGAFNASNPKMREHSLRMMSAFSSWIYNLHDGPVMDGLLILQGIQHKERGMGEPDFRAFQPCLFNAIEKRIGDNFNRQAWTNVFDFFIDGLAKGWN